jgi:tetratricopeptide (TPR) repeat protein
MARCYAAPAISPAHCTRSSSPWNSCGASATEARRSVTPYVSSARPRPRWATTTRPPINAPRAQAEALNAIGALLLNRHQPELALRRYQHALDLARRLSSRTEQAHALRGIGACARHLGQLDTAATNLRQALLIYRRIGKPEASSVADELASVEAQQLHES